jgi:hypothetical protein
LGCEWGGCKQPNRVIGRGDKSSHIVDEKKNNAMYAMFYPEKLINARFRDGE